MNGGGEPVLRPARIVDAHCHVPSASFLPASFIDGTIENVLASVGSGGEAARRQVTRLVAAMLDDEDCDRLVTEMDATGIERAILIVPDFTFALRDCPLTIAQMVDRIGLIRARHEGRFAAFLGVDPRWGEDGLALFEAALRGGGFQGMKVYPPCGFRPDDRSLYPFYEICQELRAPAMVHLGGTSHHLQFEPARPIAVEQAARDFPELPFLLAHAGTTYPEESAMLAAFRPNVYLEVSGFQAHHSAPLELLTAKGIGHKLIYGSDWPVFGMQASLPKTVERLLVPGGPLRHLRRRDVDLFFAGTIEVLLGAGDRRAEQAIPGGAG